MKNIFLSFLALSIFGCKQNSQINSEAKFPINKYVSLEYGSFDNNGELIYYVTPVIIENSDSIGKILNKHPRRVKYLLTNRINSDTLNKLLPDSISINKVFKSEISKNEFINNFKKITLPNHQPKEKFTENELLIIASKFFLVEQLPENKFGTRICSGVNGIDDNNSNKDYTLLEAIVFDAIFNRVMQQNSSNAKFMDNLSEYQKIAIKDTENLPLDNRLLNIRNSVFKSMENDQELKKYLLAYFKTNKNNIPIEITMANVHEHEM